MNAKLVKLHSWNGWNLLFLFITGVLLFVPALRGPLAPIRTPLKYLHVGSGVLSLVLLLGYLPVALEHWQRLRARIGQKTNVILLGGLLIGWGVTGAALWFNRYVPEGMAEVALVWHDRLTWFAIPWATAHAVTRYYRIRILPVKAPVEDRRVFLASAATFLGVIAWGRLGRTLGLPGFEDSTSNMAAQTHEPIPEGAEFQPVPISDPPLGGGGKGRFRVYTITDIPTFHAKTWTFKVSGLVERPLTFSWEQFLELPRTVQVSNFHCVTGWSVYDVTWEGVKLTDLLDKAGVTAKATHVKFYSGDGEYTDAVPMEVARLDDVILPYIMDGSPLPTPLGGPVRLIIPKQYAYKSVKWLQAIELIDQPHQGYWEVRGYPADAWLRKI